MLWYHCNGNEHDERLLKRYHCNTYVSNWIRLVSTRLSTVTSFSSLTLDSPFSLVVLDSDLCELEDEGRSSSNGLGCINVNGNSATKSLSYSTMKSIFNSFLIRAVAYPPRDPRNSFTLTLYCTNIPRFSFWLLSVTLEIVVVHQLLLHEEVKATKIDQHYGTRGSTMISFSYSCFFFFFEDQCRIMRKRRSC